MPINLVCNSCSGRSRAPDTMAGQRIFCPKCGTQLIVPTPLRAMLVDGGETKQTAPVNPVSPRAETAKPPSPLLPPNGQAATATGGYYITDHTGHVSGPYSGSELKKMAREGTFDLTWRVSKDRVNWCPAGQVKNLVTGLESVLAEHLPTGEQYRSLTKTEVAALFLDKFVLNNDNFKDTFPGIQQVRLWWAKLTMPKDFVIAEVTGTGVRHVKYNVGTGDTQAINEKEVNKEVANGVRRFNWFVPLAVVLGGLWLFWAVKDFILDFSPTWGTLKTLLVVGVALFGFVMKVKHSKVFVGYSLDETAVRRLEEIVEALRDLKRCSKVWIYQVTRGGGLHYKYNAGDSFKVAKLPMAFFTRSIPNVESNVRIQGITHQRTAVYFLPEKILIVSGEKIYTAAYQALRIDIDSLEYVEDEGHVYQDSRVVGHRWKYINRDGSRDRRFKDNVELPVVCCGILGLTIEESELMMMTTDPNVPGDVKAKFDEVKANAPQV